MAENVEENNIETIEEEDIKEIKEENEVESFDQLNKEITELIKKNNEISESTVIEITKMLAEKINNQENDFHVDHAITTLSQVLLNILSLLLDEDLSTKFAKAKQIVNDDISKIISKGFDEEEGASLSEFLITSSAIIDFIYSRKLINDYTIRKEG